MTTATQGIKLDTTIINRLRTLGKMRERSPHWLMKTAIERYLDQEEAYEREKREDMARWEQYQLTGTSIAHDAMTQWFDELLHSGDAPRAP